MGFLFVSHCFLYTYIMIQKQYVTFTISQMFFMLNLHYYICIKQNGRGELVMIYHSEKTKMTRKLGTESKEDIQP